MKFFYYVEEKAKKEIASMRADMKASGDQWSRDTRAAQDAYNAVCLPALEQVAEIIRNVVVDEAIPLPDRQAFLDYAQRISDNSRDAGETVTSGVDHLYDIRARAHSDNPSGGYYLEIARLMEDAYTYRPR